MLDDVMNIEKIERLLDFWSVVSVFSESESESHEKCNNRRNL